MNIRDTLHNVNCNIYKIEYNSFSRKVENQHNPNSDERSQHTVTPHHNYYYQSGSSKQHIHRYVAVT
jgi:hypothetical protein